MARNGDIPLEELSKRQEEEITRLRQIIIAFLQRYDGRAVFTRGELLHASDPAIIGEIRDENTGTLILWFDRE